MLFRNLKPTLETGSRRTFALMREHAETTMYLIRTHQLIGKASEDMEKFLLRAEARQLTEEVSRYAQHMGWVLDTAVSDCGEIYSGLWTNTNGHLIDCSLERLGYLGNEILPLLDGKTFEPLLSILLSAGFNLQVHYPTYGYREDVEKFRLKLRTELAK